MLVNCTCIVNNHLHRLCKGSVIAYSLFQWHTSLVGPPQLCILPTRIHKWSGYIKLQLHRGNLQSSILGCSNQLYQYVTVISVLSFLTPPTEPQPPTQESNYCNLHCKMGHTFREKSCGSISGNNFFRSR